MNANEIITVRFPSSTWQGCRVRIEKATEKAINIKGQWFPKSGFTQEVSETGNPMSSFVIKPWLDAKLNDSQVSVFYA